MAQNQEHDNDSAHEEPDPGGIITCWCGASGLYEDLFDDDCLDETCGGLGTLNCYCGGDQCVCHHHGETECPGCQDCDHDDSEDYDSGMHDDGRYDDE